MVVDNAMISKSLSNFVEYCHSCGANRALLPIFHVAIFSQFKRPRSAALTVQPNCRSLFLSPPASSVRADKRELFYFSCSDQFRIKTFPLQEQSSVVEIIKPVLHQGVRVRRSCCSCTYSGRFNTHL